MDEHGHGRLGDGGEILGDVLLTGADGVSSGGSKAKDSTSASSRVGLGLVRERRVPLWTG
jgi:hypothetical protein